MIDCDFIPADYHQARSQQRAIRMRSTLISVLVIIMVLWVVANRHEVSQASAMLSDIEAQQQQLSVHLAKKDAMEAEKNRLRDHQRLMDEFDQRTSLVVVLGDISRRLPETVILTRVSFRSVSLRRYAPSPKEKPAAAATAETAATTPEKQDKMVSTVTVIIMTAFANEVSEAIRCAAVLERSPLVAHVQMELKGEAVWSGRKGHQFELACELMDQSGTHP
jgi:cell division protein FtsB